jgi:hypothetical protein
VIEYRTKTGLGKNRKFRREHNRNQLGHFPDRTRGSRIPSGNSRLLPVGDSPEGPFKQMGKSRLKHEKTKVKRILLKRTHGARPTPRWPPRPTKAAHSKVPSSRLRLARGYTPPSSKLRLARGCTPTSSGPRLARGYSARARPFPHVGTGI